MRKKFLSLILLGLLCSIGNVWGDETSVIFSSANKNDAGDAFGTVSKNSSITAGSGLLKIFSNNNSNWAFSNNNKKGYRVDRNDFVFYFSGETDLTILYSQNNTTSGYLVLKKFTSTKTLDEITTSDITNLGSAIAYTSVEPIASEGAWASVPSSVTVAENKLSWTAVTGGLNVTWEGLSAGYYQLSRSASSESYMYGFTADVTSSSNPTLSGASSSPAASATDVAVSGYGYLKFSKNLSSVTAANITISPNSNGEALSSIAVDGTDASKVNFSWSGLKKETEYTINIAADAVSDGTNKNAATSLSFTTVEKTALTASWTDASPSFNVGTSATIPTFTVSGGGTLGTDYTVAYSKTDASSIITLTDGTGPISAISTSSAATAKVTATVTITNTANYKIATTEYDCDITVALPQVEKPSITANGTFTDSKTVEISCETADATIYYTTNGTDPSATNGTEYTSSFSVSSTTTVKAIAIKDDYSDSEIASATYTRIIPISSWDFTSWSDATKTGISGDGTNWSVYEKYDSKTNAESSDLSGKVWTNKIGVDGSLKYNTTTILETDGLSFDLNTHTLGVTYNQASTDLGTYQGSQYLWLYNSNSKIIIPSIPAGATIEIGVESHNGSSERGVTLKNGETNLTQTLGSAKSTTYQVCKWTNTTAGDVTITPSAGLHIYYIAVYYATYPITITSAGWATFSNASEVKIPDGVTAYYAVEKNASAVTLKEITGGYIPANTGVVVSGAAGTYNAQVSSTSATLGEVTNLLQPWLTAGTPEETTYYTLAAGPTFKLSTGGTLAAGKAYLVMPGSNAPYIIRIEDEENNATSLEVIDANDQAVKFFENGQLYIMRDGKVYDTVGRIIK